MAVSELVQVGVADSVAVPVLVSVAVAVAVSELVPVGVVVSVAVSILVSVAVGVGVMFNKTEILLSL